MFDFSRILCPTDFSEPSYQAIEIAQEIAQKFGSELIIVHVLTPLTVAPITLFVHITRLFHFIIRTSGSFHRVCPNGML
jgi:hypothetical protein